MYTLQDPTTQYPRPPFPPQQQTGPGDIHEMTPAPDHGEKAYVGCGRLAGRKALVTGADSPWFWSPDYARAAYRPVLVLTYR